MFEPSSTGHDDSHFPGDASFMGYGEHVVGDRGDPTIVNDSSNWASQTDQDPRPSGSHYPVDSQNSAMGWSSGVKNAGNLPGDRLSNAHYMSHPLLENYPSLHSNFNGMSEGVFSGPIGSYRAFDPRPSDQYEPAGDFEPAPTQGFHDASDYPGEHLPSTGGYAYPTSDQYPQTSYTSTPSDPHPTHTLYQTSGSYGRPPFLNHVSGRFSIDPQSSRTPNEADLVIATNPTRIPAPSFGSNGLTTPAYDISSLFSGGPLRSQPILPPHHSASMLSQGSEVNPSQVNRGHMDGSQQQRVQRPKFKKSPTPKIKKVKKLPCSYPKCKRSFAKPSELKRHVDAHWKISRFMCLACLEGFQRVTKDQVIIHAITKHIRTEKSRDEPTEGERVRAKDYVITL